MLKDHLTTTTDLLSRKLDQLYARYKSIKFIVNDMTMQDLHQAKLDGDHDCHLTPAGDDACDCQSECEHW